MIRLRAIPALLIACAAVTASAAAPPAGAPAGTTGLCNDGSYTSTAAKQGACSGHQGVKQWYTARGGKSGAGKGKRVKRRSTRTPATTPPANSTNSGSTN